MYRRDVSEVSYDSQLEGQARGQVRDEWIAFLELGRQYLMK